MMERRAALTDKLDQLEQQVEGTFSDAKERVNDVIDTVTDTVDSVQRTYHDAKENMSNAVNIRRHVVRHPWAMIAGAAAVGYVGTAYLRDRPNGNGSHPANGGALTDRYNGFMSVLADPEIGPVRIVEKAVPIKEKTPAPAPLETQLDVETVKDAREKMGIRMGEMFHDEIQLLKGLALGTLFGIVRDLAMKSAPAAINQPLEDAINQFTLKLGGKPIRGRILPDSWTLRRPSTTAPAEPPAYAPDPGAEQA